MAESLPQIILLINTLEKELDNALANNPKGVMRVFAITQAQQALAPFLEKYHKESALAYAKGNYEELAGTLRGTFQTIKHLPPQVIFDLDRQLAPKESVEEEATKRSEELLHAQETLEDVDKTITTKKRATRQAYVKNVVDSWVRGAKEEQRQKIADTTKEAILYAIETNPDAHTENILSIASREIEKKTNLSLGDSLSRQKTFVTMVNAVKEMEHEDITTTFASSVLSSPTPTIAATTAIAVAKALPETIEPEITKKEIQQTLDPINKAAVLLFSKERAGEEKPPVPNEFGNKFFQKMTDASWQAKAAAPVGDAIGAIFGKDKFVEDVIDQVIGRSPANNEGSVSVPILQVSKQKTKEKTMLRPQGSPQPQTIQVRVIGSSHPKKIIVPKNNNFFTRTLYRPMVNITAATFREPIKKNIETTLSAAAIHGSQTIYFNIIPFVASGIKSPWATILSVSSIGVKKGVELGTSQAQSFFGRFLAGILGKNIGTAASSAASAATTGAAAGTAIGGPLGTLIGGAIGWIGTNVLGRITNFAQAIFGGGAIMQLTGIGGVEKREEKMTILFISVACGVIFIGALFPSESTIFGLMSSLFPSIVVDNALTQSLQKATATPLVGRGFSHETGADPNIIQGAINRISRMSRPLQTPVDYCATNPSASVCQAAMRAGACKWPVAGSVTQGPGIGSHLSLTGSSFNAIDIGTAMYAPTYSLSGGTVIEVGNKYADDSGYEGFRDDSVGAPRKGLYGNYVVVKTPEGYNIMYAHLAYNSMPKIGQSVSPNQLVGRSGDTGNSTGPHIHLELFGAGAPSIASLFPGATIGTNTSCN